MRLSRTIYFNDARHYYLFVYDPPMRMEDAWVPVDEVAGTSVDTFSYGVSRADGLFYPSKVGLQWGSDRKPFQNAYEWRCWENMQSLIARGLDPLQVLIDRAHSKNMDFIASLRLGGYGGMNPDHSVANGGRGFVHTEVGDHQRAVVEELATSYDTEAVELDFSAAPGGCAQCLNPDEAPEQASVLTDFVRDCAAAVRGRSGDPGLLGARIYPTPDLNRRAGLDVETWLAEGLVDFVIPSSYSCFILDAQMPIGWIVEAAHRQDVSVYGMLQPFFHDGTRTNTNVSHASPEKYRAAASNFWQADVDGMCTWFMDWPLGDAQRSMLSELGDPDLGARKNKQYVLVRTPEDDQLHYRSPLPVRIAADDVGTRHRVPFYIADDLEGARDHISEVLLEVVVTDLVSADRLAILLNGESLQTGACRRGFGDPVNRYSAQSLTFDLRGVRPRQGNNLLEIALEGRAGGLASPLVVRDVKLTVNYHPFPARL